MAVSKGHPDPTKDRRGCYKAGDPVVVRPDGWQWGAAEGLPLFWVVKVPGATVAQLEQYVEALSNADGTVNRRRSWSIDTAKMPGNIRNQLNTTGVITITLTQVQNFLTKKGLL